MRDYVEVTYDSKDKPFTKYPLQLAKYLVNRYDFKPGQKILDVGCGRGEFLWGFIAYGLQGFGADQSLYIKKLYPEVFFARCDLEKTLPFDACRFDIVFSKSVIEHFYYPEKVIQKIYQVLKPGGILITMTPDCTKFSKGFHDDYTHRTSFTLNSLKELLIIGGFDDVKVEKFLQLPILWAYPWLKLLTKIAALLPASFGYFVKWSKSVMLLASAIKPIDEKDEVW